MLSLDSCLTMSAIRNIAFASKGRGFNPQNPSLGCALVAPSCPPHRQSSQNTLNSMTSWGRPIHLKVGIYSFPAWLSILKI